MKSASWTIVMAAGLGLSLSACSEVPASSSVQTAEQAKQDTTARKATAILNAGVMAHLGSADGLPVKVLFDPLYDDHFGSFEEMTPELIEAIVSGAPPYNGVSAVFVSHAHGDHISPEHLVRMMVAQPDLFMVAPQQALGRLQQASAWQPEMADRVRVFSLDNGEATDAFQLAGMTIEAFRSPHNGWPDRHANVHNLTYRVTYENSDGATLRVMHLGDADPDPAHFSDLTDMLSAQRSGLAMVPFWFYQEEALDALVDQTLNAQSMVAMHVPVRVPAYLREGDRPYFTAVGETADIPATQ